MSEFLEMGGYAFYVWTSYGIFAAVVAWCTLSPALRRRRFEREYRENQALIARRKQDHDANP